MKFICREMEQIYNEGFKVGEKLGIEKGEKLAIAKGELKKSERNRPFPC